MDAPFVTHPWVSENLRGARAPPHADLLTMLQNYTQPNKDGYETQHFRAALQAQQYASGGIESAAARGWVVVLALVFVMNIGVLVYFILHRGLVTDFTEPPNLFALAVNSPPSHVLAGSCGGGPEGKHYMVNWFVNHEGNHLFMEPGEKTALLSDVRVHSQTHGPVQVVAPQEMNSGAGGFLASMTGAVRHRLGMKSKPPQKLKPANAVESLRPVQSRPVSMVGSEYELQESSERTRKHYQKLANRKSLL
jgi:hypothetical protein